jgi:hypothetical protein
MLVGDVGLDGEGELVRMLEPSMESMPWPVEGLGGEGAHVRVCWVAGVVEGLWPLFPWD